MRHATKTKNQYLAHCRPWMRTNGVVKHNNSANYTSNVEELLRNKVHHLRSHFSLFPENLREVSEEKGEKFHQDIKVMEERYIGT